MAKYAHAKPEAWYFVCQKCGRRGMYVGSFGAVVARTHSANDCGGELKITGRRI